MAETVFVYGTLRQGFFNHHVMERAGGTLIGPGTTLNRFSMFSMGGFPAVWIDIPVSRIYGEVYEVENLQPLDILEGFPDFYTRLTTLVETNDGHEVAWMYVLNPQCNDCPTPENLIQDGVWR